MNLKRLLLPSLAFLGAHASVAAFDLVATITGTAESHELSWPTRSGYLYRVEYSFDLQTWCETGIVEVGDDNPPDSDKTYTLKTNQADMYYRIVETTDDERSGFLDLPTHFQEVDLIDGVCFAFDLAELPQLP